MFVTLGACGGSRVRDPGLPGRLDGQSTWIMNEVPRASHSALLICCKLQSCKVSQPPRCAGARSCGGWWGGHPPSFLVSLRGRQNPIQSEPTFLQALPFPSFRVDSLGDETALKLRSEISGPALHIEVEGQRGCTWRKIPGKGVLWPFKAEPKMSGSAPVSQLAISSLDKCQSQT